MAPPAYITQYNVHFDSQIGLSDVAEFDANTPRLLVKYDSLDVTGKAHLDEIVQAAGGVLPLGPSAGFSRLRVGAGVAAGDATGLPLDLTVGDPEITTFTMVPDVSGSLAGTYFTLNVDSDTLNYYFWFNVAARPEITDIDFTGHTIVAGDYFLIDEPTIGGWHVWFDVDASGAIDPAPTANGMKVDILSGDTDAQVAAKVALALNTPVFSAPVPGANVVTVTALNNGAVADATDFNAGVGITVTQQGLNASVDPAPFAGTGVAINISADDSASAIAIAARSAISSEDGIGSALGAGDDVIVTALNPGANTDATAGDSGVGVVVNQQGDAVSGIAFTATITVDDTPIVVSIDSESALTYADLLTDLDAELAGAATSAIVDGKIVITSATTGSSSNVHVEDIDLFFNLDGFFVIDYEFEGTDDVEILDTYILPHGKSWNFTYGTITRLIGTKPKISDYSTVDTTLTYWNGTDWVRLVDDAAI